MQFQNIRRKKNKHFLEESQRKILKVIYNKQNKGCSYLLKCLECGEHFIIHRNVFNKGRGIFCSRKCYASYQHSNNLRHKHHNWKGGKVNHDGYILAEAAGHPQVNSHGYVREHRLVMEKHIGRYLNKEEIVHHINGIKADNRLENLQIMTQKEHLSLHMKLKNKKESEEAKQDEAR